VLRIYIYLFYHFFVFSIYESDLNSQGITLQEEFLLSKHLCILYLFRVSSPHQIVEKRCVVSEQHSKDKAINIHRRNRGEESNDSYSTKRYLIEEHITLSMSKLILSLELYKIAELNFSLYCLRFGILNRRPILTGNKI